MSPSQADQQGWTLLAKANLDSVSGYKRIFNSGGWGDYGAYVYYGQPPTLTTYNQPSIPQPSTLHPKPKP